MKKFLRFLGFVALAVLVGSTAAVAGSLGPSAAPANTMYTLSDVYALVTTGTTTASSGFSTPGSVSASMYSLSEIVEAFASSTRNLTADNIADGVSILGVEGTLSGGSPTLEWDTRSTSTNLRLCYNNSYNNGLCDDGGEGYDGGLIIDQGNVLGATEYCQYLQNDGLTLAATPQNIWRIPTLAEMHDRIFSENRWYEFQEYQLYWTSTPDIGYINGSGTHHFVFDFDGYYVDSVHKGYNLPTFRCVKEV